MAIRVRDASNTRRTVAPKLRDVGGAVRIIKTGKIRDAGNVVRLFYTAITATATPASISGTRTSSEPTITVQSDYTVVTPAGGTPPYHYVWGFVEGENENGMYLRWPVGAPADSNSVQAYYTQVPAGETWVATAWCIVTDANGATADAFCNCSLTHVVG